jgi:anti-sigma-K factor RskA
VNHPMATDEVKEQAALYALGALSQIEARRFESHLADNCGVCKAELSQFEEVVGALGLDAPEVAPPPDLRARLLERIGAESQGGSRQTPTGGVVAAAQPRPAERKVRGGSSWLAWAIAACLAVFSIVTLVQSRRSSDQIAAIQSLVDREKGALEEERQVNATLNSPDHSRVDLSGTAGHTSDSGQVYVDNAHKRWVVVADLQPATAGKEYQLWFIAPSAGGPVSAGILKTDDLGHGFSVIQVPPDLGQIQGAAISLEPQGGSKKPTTVVVAGKLS